MSVIKNLLVVSALSLLAASCGTTYVRHSNLHHVQTSAELTVYPKKTEVREVRRDLSASRVVIDTTVSYTPGTELKTTDPNDKKLYLLENGNVVWYHNSYWIKKGAKIDEYAPYVNQDVQF